MFATQLSATVFSPALGGWRNVMFLFGVPAFALGLLWLFTGREPDKTENPYQLTTKISFRQSISHVIRIKEVWLIGFITFMLWGATMGYVGYLPLYLRNIGWDATSADTTITVLSLMMFLGSVPTVLLSDKLKTRKGVLVISIASVAIFLALLPFVDATWIWILLIISSFLRSAANSLFNVMIFETEGIGATYGGTAIGLANTISMLGAFLAPPLGNSLVKYGEGMPFIFWACLSATSIGLLLLINTKKKPVMSYQQ
jgi:predicted MFS family arabinose efflux permease